MITLKNAVRIFATGDQQVKALDGVNMRIESGDYLAIMGPSGCGKTTLLNVIAGFDRLDEGECLYYGRNINEMNAEQLEDYRRNEIGVIFQQPSLLDYLTVKDNILLAGSYNRKKASIGQLRQLCEKLGIDDCLRKYPSQLSGGQKQRAAIARIILYGKQLVLADEPTGALDETNGSIIMDIFDRMVEDGCTVIVVTHDRRVAQRCRHTIFMENGHVAD